MSMSKILPTVLMLAGFGLTSTSSCAEVLKAELGQNSVQTIVGPLRVVKKSGEDYVFDVVLNDKHIAQIGEYMSAFIKGAYPSRDAASHVLLVEVTGGNQCDGFYRFVEIKRDGSAIVTDEFGTCFPLDHIVHEGDSWKFVIPESGKKAPVVWEYQNSRLTKLGKPETLKPTDPDWQLTKRFEIAVPDAKERENLIRKHGGVQAAYRAWVMEDAKRKIRPSQFRADDGDNKGR